MSTPPDELTQGSVDLAQSFERAGADYALMGGLAVGYRTLPRFTKDIDFIISVPQLNLPGLLEDLAARGVDLDLPATIREWNQHHMIALSYNGLRVDWLKPILPAYRHVIERATTETWLGGSIRVASAEGLILLKLLASRGQDWLDIDSLIAVYGPRLDLDWIRGEWLTIAALDDPRFVRFLGLLDPVENTATS